MLKTLNIFYYFYETEVVNNPNIIDNNTKSYENISEYNVRENVYLMNLIKISQHNSENHPWTMAGHLFMRI